MRLILLGGYLFGKMWKNMEKRPFFRAAMAGLGKYHMSGYGRIGVYRVRLGNMPHFVSLLQKISCTKAMHFLVTQQTERMLRAEIEH